MVLSRIRIVWEAPPSRRCHDKSEHGNDCDNKSSSHSVESPVFKTQMAVPYPIPLRLESTKIVLAVNGLACLTRLVNAPEGCIASIDAVNGKVTIF